MKPSAIACALLSASAVVAAVATVACGSFSASDDGATPDGGDAAADGTTIVGVPQGCDLDADAKDAPKCVVNEVGVFVDSGSGNDSNPGTRESPVKTITSALGKVGSKEG